MDQGPLPRGSGASVQFLHGYLPACPHGTVGTRADANPPAADPARETFVLMCPFCNHAAVIPLGRVTTSPVGIRCDYRCASCSKEFVFLR